MYTPFLIPRAPRSDAKSRPYSSSINCFIDLLKNIYKLNKLSKLLCLCFSSKSSSRPRTDCPFVFANLFQDAGVVITPDIRLRVSKTLRESYFLSFSSRAEINARLPNYITFCLHHRVCHYNTHSYAYKLSHNLIVKERLTSNGRQSSKLKTEDRRLKKKPLALFLSSVLGLLSSDLVELRGIEPRTS